MEVKLTCLHMPTLGLRRGSLSFCVSEEGWLVSGGEITYKFIDVYTMILLTFYVIVFTMVINLLAFYNEFSFNYG